MKMHGRQLRLDDLPGSVAEAWRAYTPEEGEVVHAIASVLGWSLTEASDVEAALAEVDRDPPSCLLGKDILDFLFRLVQEDGHGEIRGWNREFFHRQVLQALRPSDGDNWVVVERLRQWASNQGQDLLLSSTRSDPETQP
jgi:hypothetical protein